MRQLKDYEQGRRSGSILHRDRTPSPKKDYGLADAKAETTPNLLKTSYHYRYKFNDSADSPSSYKGYLTEKYAKSPLPDKNRLS